MRSPFFWLGLLGSLIYLLMSNTRYDWLVGPFRFELTGLPLHLAEQLQASWWSLALAFLLSPFAIALMRYTASNEGMPRWPFHKSLVLRDIFAFALWLFFIWTVLSLNGRLFRIWFIIEGHPVSTPTIWLSNLGILLFIYLTVKLAFMLPAIALNHPMTPKQAWHSNQNVILPLFAAVATILFFRQMFEGVVFWTALLLENLLGLGLYDPGFTQRIMFHGVQWVSIWELIWAFFNYLFNALIAVTLALFWLHAEHASPEKP